jgi:hypothetical protein
LSSIWNIPKLLSLYDEIPKTNFFGGHVVFNLFVTGTGIVISRDLIDKLLTINTNIIRDNDDVAISKHMINVGVPIRFLNNLSNYKWNHQVIDMNESDITSPHHKNNNLEISENTYIDDILYFRVRNSSTTQDLIVTKKIIKRIYNIEL